MTHTAESMLQMAASTPVVVEEASTETSIWVAEDFIILICILLKIFLENSLVGEILLPIFSMMTTIFSEIADLDKWAVLVVWVWTDNELITMADKDNSDKIETHLVISACKWIWVSEVVLTTTISSEAVEWEVWAIIFHPFNQAVSAVVAWVSL